MSEYDDTRVRFSGIKSGKYPLHFMLDDAFFATFKNEDLQRGNVRIDAIFERMEHMLMFHFQLEGVVSTICDRCLGEIALPIEGEETLCVRFSDTEVSEDENVAILPEDAYEIDLAQWLYEYIAVRIPLHHIHPDGECDPTVIAFINKANDEAEDSKGEEMETDPRWDALKKLK